MATSYYTGSTVNARLGEFTPRQTEAAIWVTEGKPDPEIAVIMGCTPRTVKAHVTAVMSALNCHTRAQMVGKLFMEGVVSARHMALVLCVTMSTGALSDFGRSPLNNGRLQLKPNAPAAPTSQPFRIRSGGSRTNLRSGRLFRTARTSRKES